MTSTFTLPTTTTDAIARETLANAAHETEMMTVIARARLARVDDGMVRSTRAALFGR